MSQLDAYEVDEVFGCHLWTGKLDRDGYGVVWKGRIATRAYVAAWVAANGPVPSDRVLDHLCRRRSCCAPHHLEPVTKSVNALRMNSQYRHRTMKRCPKGHELSINGITTPQSGRVCRQCNEDASNGHV